MVVPLAYRHGPAGTIFVIAVAAWLVFEFVMRIRQRLAARGPSTLDPTYYVLVLTLGAAIVVAGLLGRRGGQLWRAACSGPTCWVWA